VETTVTGGCLCGAVRYEYRGEIGAAGYCHCADCRRISGSAFGISVRVAASGFRITAGRPKAYTKTSDAGRPVTRWFCPDCGCPLYTEPPLHPETIFLKAGSLDDSALVQPDRQAWTRSRVTWAEIDPALASYETSRT
jgi:hypothetical protein